MAHSESIHLTEERYVMTGRTRSILFALMAIGIIVTIIGIFQVKGGAHIEPDHHAMVSAGSEPGHGGHHGPSWTARVWANLLLNSYYALLIGICGTFFIALNYITNAGWATGLLRIPAAMGMYIPFGLVFVLIAIVFGGQEMYHWLHEGITETGSANFDPIIEGKSGFLNKGWLYIGVPLIILFIFFINIKLRSLSMSEDREGGVTFFKKSVNLSGAFTFIFAFGFSLMAWIVVMSIDPHWYSTIYSIYNWAISFVCGMTVVVFIVLFLKKQGYLSFINSEHIHDIGKFMFAFTIFWTYIWIAQYLLIWYANIPEESKYFYERQEGNNGIYHFQFWFNLILCFVIPFLGLMTRNAKRSPTWLYIIGTIILVGHWNDLYLMIMPGVLRETAGLGLLEFGMPIFFVGLFAYVVLHFLQKAPLFPLKHPYLEESVHHDVGV